MYLILAYTFLWFLIEYFSYYFWNYFFYFDVQKLQSWEQRQFYTKTVAFSHAFLVSLLSINNISNLFLNHKNDFIFSQNSLHYINQEIKLTILITMTYFIWDIITCFKEKQPVDIFIHAFIGFIGSFISWYYHILPIYVIFAILYEISTPFLNLRWFLIKINRSDNHYFTIIQNCFGYFFVFFRILLGFILINSFLFYDIYINQHILHLGNTKIQFYLIILIKIISDLLNLFWLHKILKMKNNSKKKSLNK